MLHTITVNNGVTLYKLLMFRAAYLDLPFSPLVALTEVVDVDMLDKQSQHEALL